MGTLDPFHELVGTSAHRLDAHVASVAALYVLLADDKDLVNIADEPRGRGFGLENNGVFIRRLNAGDSLTSFQPFGKLWIGQAFKGKFHVGRGKWVAIVELNTFTQDKPPGQSVRVFVFLSQTENNLSFLAFAGK